MRIGGKYVAEWSLLRLRQRPNFGIALALVLSNAANLYFGQFRFMQLLSLINAFRKKRVDC